MQLNLNPPKPNTGNKVSAGYVEQATAVPGSGGYSYQVDPRYIDSDVPVEELYRRVIDPISRRSLYDQMVLWAEKKSVTRLGGDMDLYTHAIKSLARLAATARDAGLPYWMPNVEQLRLPDSPVFNTPGTTMRRPWTEVMASVEEASPLADRGQVLARVPVATPSAVELAMTRRFGFRAPQIMETEARRRKWYHESANRLANLDEALTAPAPVNGKYNDRWLAQLTRARIYQMRQIMAHKGYRMKINRNPPDHKGEWTYTFWKLQGSSYDMLQLYGVAGFGMVVDARRNDFTLPIFVQNNGAKNAWDQGIPLSMKSEDFDAANGVTAAEADDYVACWRNMLRYVRDQL